MAASCPAGTKKTVIFFVNGILTLPEDAIIYKAVLEKKFKDFLSTTVPSNPKLNPNCLEFDYAYNQTLGLLEDIYESYRQKTQESSEDFWRFRLSISLPPAQVTETLVDELSKIDPDLYVLISDLNKHLDQYRSEFSEKNVVVVAHSQGNFFANQAFDGLTEIERNIFGIVAVATPSSSVNGYTPGNEPYTTLEEDKVIDAVRKLFPNTLPPNTSNGVLNVEPNGHAFLGAYLTGSNSDSELHIFLNLVAVISQLPDSTEPEPSDKFAGGDRVRVNTGDGSNLNVRDSAGGAVLGQQSDGALGTVIGGPEFVDGVWWWQVDFDDGVDGWVAEAFLSAVVEPTITFHPIQQLGLVNHDGFSPTVVAQGSHFHVVWRSHEFDQNGNVVNDIFYRRSTDSGISFEPIQMIATYIGGGSSPPHMVVTDSTVIITWCQSTVFLRRSTNGGMTFEEPPIEIGNGCSSQLASSSERISVVWNNDIDILYRRSTDAVLHFGPIINITNIDTSQPNEISLSHISIVDSGDTIAIVWKGTERDQNDPEDFGSSSALRTSIDGGETFGPIHGAGSGISIDPAPQVDADGLTVGVVSATELGYRSFYKESQDGGQTFGETQTYFISEDELFNTFSPSGNTFRIKNGVFHSVWAALDTIIYRRSIDSGMTFESITNFPISRESSFGPTVSINESNILAMVWVESEIIQRSPLIRESDILFVDSIDAGNTFRGVQIITEAVQPTRLHTPQMATDFSVS